MNQTFSLHAYAELVDELRQRGYKIADFTDVDMTSKQLVLRHDIDMSIDSALRKAEIEAELGVQSTYFVLIRSEIYNLFTKSGTDNLKQIISLGHEIGLHFDASFYADNQQEELNNYCQAEITLLESWLGIKIQVVSFHRPAPVFQGVDSLIAGRAHTYQSRYFNEMVYCSDSRGGWHYGHPLDLDGVKEGRSLQLLTHPIWWNSTGNEAPIERLDRFVTAKQTKFQHELAHNCQPYAEALLNRSSK